MKINIWSDGDSSVGINGGSATVDINGLEDCIDEIYRDEIRETLKAAFVSIFDDGSVNVLFEDEMDI